MSIATEFPATRQAVFDHVAQHLKEQNCQCMNEKGTCVYRGPNGMACAIGACIPDEWYEEKWDKTKGGTTAGSVLEDLQVRGRIDQDTFVDLTYLVYDLQSVHDVLDSGYPEKPDIWIRKLREVAKKYELSTEVIDQWT